jgi:hypothetical protein
MAGEPRSVDRDELLDSAMELQERIAAIDPNLVVRLTFGPRDKAAAASGNTELANNAEAASFRNGFGANGHFANSFSKDGDGFTNISWLVEA